MSGKTRASNIELLRIVLMGIIILHHFCVHGIILPLAHVSSTASLSWQLVLTQLVGWGGQMANGVFILITGYFLIGRRVNYKRIALLAVTMLLYAWVIFGFFKVSHIMPITGSNKAYLLPMWSGENWFVSCYILFALFIPFLNRCLEQLPKKQFSLGLIAGYIVFFIMPNFHGNNFMNGSPQFLFFVFMYSLGAYFKRFLVYNLDKEQGTRNKEQGTRDKEQGTRLRGIGENAYVSLFV